MKDASLVAHNRAWWGLWQNGVPCCMLISWPSGTGKGLYKDRSPGSLAHQVTAANWLPLSLDHRDTLQRDQQTLSGSYQAVKIK